MKGAVEDERSRKAPDRRPEGDEERYLAIGRPTPVRPEGPKSARARRRAGDPLPKARPVSDLDSVFFPGAHSRRRCVDPRPARHRAPRHFERGWVTAGHTHMARARRQHGALQHRRREGEAEQPAPRPSSGHLLHAPRRFECLALHTWPRGSHRAARLGPHRPTGRRIRRFRRLSAHQRNGQSRYRREDRQLAQPPVARAEGPSHHVLRRTSYVPRLTSHACWDCRRPGSDSIVGNLCMGKIEGLPQARRMAISKRACR